MKYIYFTFILISFIILGFKIAYPFDKDYRINDLSLDDAVFSDFRSTLIFYNSLAKLSKTISFQFKIATYKVKKHDSIENIASRIGLNEDSIISINYISNHYDLNIGSTIFIPNVRGSFIYLDKLTNINSLARQFNIPIWLLSKVNRFNKYTNILYSGQRVFIPFRMLSKQEWQYFNASKFHSPLKTGYISSPFGIRKDPFKHKKTFHGGLDIAAPTGTPVYSSQRGQVVFTGYVGGYGNLIVIKHLYDYKTLYGHLSRIRVKKGEYVSKKQYIGNVGSTGRSTGPHLHFEIVRNKVKLNPHNMRHSN